MKHLIPALILAAVPLALTSCGKTSVAAESAKSPAPAPDPAAFVETYRKAMETKDTSTLDSFLLTDGSPAEVVEFFRMMRDAPRSSPIQVELKTPTAEQAAQFSQAMEMPDGKYYKLPLTPTWQLVISSENKEDGSSSRTSSSFPVAQKDGKFVIPMPVPTGQAAQQP